MKKTLILVSITIVFFIGVFLNVSLRKKMGYAVHGIDISYYQKEINFDKVVKDGFSFVFMKATEGGRLKDKTFERNWKAAHKNELIKSAYHFFRANVDPYQQANLFVKHVKLSPGDLPPVLDVETLDNVAIPVLRERVSIWLNLVEKKYGVTPILYTNLSFYHDVFYGRKAFDKYPIWIAAYGRFLKPSLKDDDKNWSMWQYTDSGNSKGIKGDVDLNVFHGTIDDLRRMCIPGKFSEAELNIHIPKSLPKVGNR